MNPNTTKVIDFLRSIDLPIEISGEVTVTQWSVWPETAIINGVLHVTEDAHPGHVLHEAGHLAIAPSELRSKLHWDLCIEQLPKELDNRWMYMNDSAVSAWQYFAAEVAGVPVELPFMVGYDDDPSGLEILDAIKFGIGTTMGSAPTAQLFYSGMMESKGSGVLLKFLQD